MIDRRLRGWWLALLLGIAAPSAAQIPAAPGTQGVAPRDEDPSSPGSGLAPAVVPTESEPSAPEVIDLMNRSRANAEATKAPLKAKPSPKPRKKPSP